MDDQHRALLRLLGRAAGGRRCASITARNPVLRGAVPGARLLQRRVRLAAAARRVPRDRAGARLRRRGDGAVPVRGDDARHQHRHAARRASGSTCRSRAVVGVVIALEMAAVLLRGFRLRRARRPRRPPALKLGNTKRARHRCSTPTTCTRCEIAAVILLVAIVAAIALTLRRRKDAKHIDPAEQVKAQGRPIACASCAMKPEPVPRDRRQRCRRSRWRRSAMTLGPVIARPLPRRSARSCSRSVGGRHLPQPQATSSCC